MKVVLGALAGLAGAAAGLLVSILLATLFAKLANISDREGAAAYFVAAVGILGALAGTGVGVFLFARSAPEGEAARSAGAAVLGLLGLAALVALVVWGWVGSREGPAKYGDTLASLELEFRVLASDAPAGAPSGWLDVEVQTSTTRPPGTVLSDRVREEDGFLVVPVVQNPLIRSSGRSVVVRVANRRVEVFVPRMKAKPDPKAGWSAWQAPRLVEMRGGGAGSGEGAKPILEMRYRIRLYGE
jgi:MFS family permease